MSGEQRSQRKARGPEREREADTALLPEVSGHSASEVDPAGPQEIKMQQEEK